MINKKTQDQILENDSERVKALLEYGILDGTMDEELNDLVNLASEICGTSISLVTLLDEDKQWFKAKKGLASDGSAREVAFCNHTIQNEEIFEVKDASKDVRFMDNPFVKFEDHFRFYAGVPLTNRDGHNLGALCVIDTKPNQLSEFQKRSLKTLARQVVRKFDYDLNQKQLREHTNSLQSANDKLQKLSRLNVNLLSAMAHDLRNNLAGSESVLSLIKDRVKLGEDMEVLVKEQLKGTSQAYKLLSDLVTWGSSYVKSGEIQKEEVDPSETVDTVLTDLSDHAMRKDVKLYNRIRSGQEIQTDSEMLKFIFRNLVQNAIKFSEDCKVNVGFDQDKQAYFVSDEGQGMSKVQLEKLFSWDRSKVKKGTAGEAGSGIGLMLCCDFIDRHGGSIWASSTEGKGTTFYFTLQSEK